MQVLNPAKPWGKRVSAVLNSRKIAEFLQNTLILENETFQTKEKVPKTFVFSTFLRLFLVDLTRLDSNKFKAILRFKRQIADSLEKPSDVIISYGALESTRRLNTFGEMEAVQVDQHHKDLSDKEIDDIVAGYLSGKSTYTLAEEFGCHRHTVSKALEKRGIVVDKCKAMKKLDEERVVSLYAAMQTIEGIAKQFDVSSNTISKCLKSHGVKMRSRWDYTNK